MSNTTEKPDSSHVTTSGTGMSKVSFLIVEPCYAI